MDLYVLLISYGGESAIKYMDYCARVRWLLNCLILIASFNHILSWKVWHGAPVYSVTVSIYRRRYYTIRQAPYNPSCDENKAGFDTNLSKCCLL